MYQHRTFCPFLGPLPLGPSELVAGTGLLDVTEARLSGLFATGFLYPGVQGAFTLWVMSPSRAGLCSEPCFLTAPQCTGRVGIMNAYCRNARLQE